MSSLPPRIPRDQAAQLPWQDILTLFSLQHIRELERYLELPTGTITRAWSTAPKSRGLSAKTHLVLLKGIASQFTSSQELRSWLKKHWPAKWLEKIALSLEILYTELDLTHQVSSLGVFPCDYLSRDEESELLGWLLNDKQAQVFWITGPGGTGKSTLALSLVRRHQSELSRRFDHVLWIDGEQGNFDHCLRQVAEQLQLTETGNPEEMIRHKASHLRLLILLDTLHNPVELARWRQLVGTLGKFVVTSRTRLSEPELRSDDALRQMRLGGFSLEQSRIFMRQGGQAIDHLHEKTDGLPLALRILSGLLHELGCSADELVKRLESQVFEALSYPPALDSRQSSLRACFTLTEQTLAEKHPQAATYFRAAGVFQTRTMLKSLLDEAAEIHTALDGDRLLGILLRYNLVESLTMRGERFIQLHPLLHEFAREKASPESELTEHYWDAMETWMEQAHEAFSDGLLLPSIRLHQADLLQVFEQWAHRAEWRRILNSLEYAFELFLLDSIERTPDTNLLAMLQTHLPANESQETILIRAMLLNAQAYHQYIAMDYDQLAASREAARALLTGIQPEPELEAFYQAELAGALRGQARYLQVTGRPAEALELLRSPEVAAALEHSKCEATQYLLAGILADLDEHAQALDILQSIQEEYQRGSSCRFTQTYLLVEMADRQRDLGQWNEAIRLYETAFAEEQSPPYVRAEYGRSLAACLRKRQDFQRADQVLEIVESLLEDNPADLFQKSLACAWQERAETYQGLENREEALTFARKALALAEKVGDADTIENLQDLLKQIN